MEQNCCRISTNYSRIASWTQFWESDQVLNKVYIFNYLGSIISFYDRDCPDVSRNLYRAWSKLGWFSCLLGQEGGDTRTYGMFYMAVVHYLLLFGSEYWVITPRILQSLGILKNQVAWRISVCMPRCQRGYW